ncbi:hypothetical protein ALC60_12978 [Trachymyrmex zeteki]|uniref:Uncharacterized protein n=1 Tax=Mycetomoellerius zeteki TaxID=64791 RepID=A0A151WJI2_9HYME|nr:hypothetical protein ALC60_12978 [Trachymyrmex zeteki]
MRFTSPSRVDSTTKRECRCHDATSVARTTPGQWGYLPPTPKPLEGVQQSRRSSPCSFHCAHVVIGGLVGAILPTSEPLFRKEDITKQPPRITIISQLIIIISYYHSVVRCVSSTRYLAHYVKYVIRSSLLKAMTSYPWYDVGESYKVDDANITQCSRQMAIYAIASWGVMMLHKVKQHSC